jgi:hypothetical protein
MVFLPLFFGQPKIHSLQEAFFVVFGAISALLHFSIRTKVGQFAKYTNNNKKPAIYAGSFYSKLIYQAVCIIAT